MPTIEENLGRIADASERTAAALEALVKLKGAPATGKTDAFAEAIEKVPAEGKSKPATKSTTKTRTAAPKAEPAPEPEPEPDEEEEEVVEDEDDVEEAEAITHETVRAWQRDARAKYANDAAMTAALKSAYPNLIRKHGGEEDGKANLPLVPEDKLPALLAALKKVVSE